METLLNIGASYKDQVNEMQNMVNRAGGMMFAVASLSEGSMYGVGFADLDGHRWNMLHMDMSKMSQL